MVVFVWVSDFILCCLCRTNETRRWKKDRMIDISLGDGNIMPMSCCAISDFVQIRIETRLRGSCWAMQRRQILCPSQHHWRNVRSQWMVNRINCFNWINCFGVGPQLRLTQANTALQSTALCARFQHNDSVLDLIFAIALRMLHLIEFNENVWIKLISILHPTWNAKTTTTTTDA